MVNNNQNRCPDGFLYTIVIGDTLYSIANKYNISVQSIINANPDLQVDRLQVEGHSLVMEGPSTGLKQEIPYTVLPDDMV